MSGEHALLVLADGTRFAGTAFGADTTAVGEVVFTTGMTGYQEVLTDPSYCGQLVTMTATQIGNTGINPHDGESVAEHPHVAGFIVRDHADEPSSWRATSTLHHYLESHGVVALSNVDTRALTRHIRDHGAQNGAMGRGSAEELQRAAQRAPAMSGLDLVARVTPDEPYPWTEGSGVWTPSVGARTHDPHSATSQPATSQPATSQPATSQTATSQTATTAAVPNSADRGHVVVLDLGIKRNILRSLIDVGFRVTAVPATTSAADILALDPDGIFLSNGPGDPAAVTYAVDTVGELIGDEQTRRPTFGICLGHQILALAAGASTYKLKFGHRGLNQPVKDLTTGRVEITLQNHGFAVDLESLEGKARSTHVHLNDGTSEGLAIDAIDAFSVQYHPEAAAGPHDALYLFERFAERVARFRDAR